ncbi:DUF4238 domain-containing protein [Candidatus Poribacteria bacterium]|nr:DUF4238 domain-containing protein [Candidatus Poribacteria bacterium]
MHGAKEFVPDFLGKERVLFETTRKHPFFISDNPIVLQNEMNQGPYSGLGVAAPGIEIYLPISSTLCLGLFCPSVAEEFQITYEKTRMLNKATPALA